MQTSLIRAIASGIQSEGIKTALNALNLPGYHLPKIESVCDSRITFRGFIGHFEPLEYVLRVDSTFNGLAFDVTFPDGYDDADGFLSNLIRQRFENVLLSQWEF